MLNINIIDQPHQLDLLYTRIRSATYVAIDTEFHSENRYIPELMLIQVSIQRGEVFLVDVLAGLNLDPLGRLLNQKIIITHGGRQDFRLLYKEIGLRAARVFDTQIMAGMLGWHFPMRFDDLLERAISISVEKTSTLSDWKKRPLSEQQKNYAAEDANQLLPIFNQLKHLLHTKDKFELSEKASVEYMERALMPKIPEEIWPYWSVAEGMGVAQRNILNNLLRWRESTALDKNRPSNYILPQHIAIDLARRAPTNTEEIRENRKINRSLISKHGGEILLCIRNGLLDQTIFRVITSEDKELSRTLQLWSIALANTLSINHALLLSERRCNQIAMHGVDEVLVGWRHRVIAEHAKKFLNGQTAIRMSSDGPILIACG